ncbi:MAG TPA: tRNA epoxyqueuosine(34) reductase QueG [Rikenellaceae bacterium]|nr:tRNA epoxyqueuosine(34) reductase QueG [Rikenellaceae bacterium]
MNTDKFHEIICDLSLKAGFIDYGAAPVKKLTADCKYLNEYIRKGHNAGMNYMARNISLREDPGLLVEDAKSVLCFLAPYKPSENQESSLPQISSYAFGLDYHHVIKEKLYKILEEIISLMPDAKARVFTDSAPVFERAWAARAGLGFIGKNTFLISKSHGLHTLIGLIILNKEVKYGKQVSQGCGNCTKCLDCCPTGALYRPFGLDARKCISYHTIESKPDSHEEFMVDLNNSIFGCEICLRACPWSGKGKPGEWPEFMPLNIVGYSKKITELSSADWENMDEKTFNLNFSDSPLFRAGLRKIKISLGTKKDSL